jgi:RNA polymerase sigma-70 factor (ECF subfamily)
VSRSSDDVERALEATRVGDGEALGVLWRAHQPLLLRYVRGRGLRDAEDVATQVWIDAARNLPRFSGDASDFRRWLFTIAHRRLVDERRRQARWLTPPPTASSGTSSPGADVGFEEADGLVRALELVARLPEQMRDVVLLRVVADLSVAETASVMGLRDGHVRVLMHRGLAMLERMLNDDVGELVTLRASATMKRST